MGIIFYQSEGNIYNKNLNLTAVDVLPLSVGEPSEVGFSGEAEGAKIMKYIIENEHLEDCKRAIIHSHHNMGTFFSGTDTTQLKEWCKDKPYFLSIVTNNKLEFTAKIAFEIIRHNKYFKFIKDALNKLIPISEEEESEERDVEIVQLANEIETPIMLQQLIPYLTNMSKYTVPYTQFNRQSTPLHSSFLPQNNSKNWSQPTPNSEFAKNTWVKKQEMIEALKEYTFDVDEQKYLQKEAFPQIAASIIFNPFGYDYKIEELLIYLKNEPWVNRNYSDDLMREISLQLINPTKYVYEYGE